MSVDLDKELRKLLLETKDQKYRQLLLFISRSSRTAKELLNGIEQDNAKMLNGVLNMQGVAPEKISAIKGRVELLQNIVWRINHEIDTAPYSPEYMIKLLESLIQTRNLLDKALSKINNKTILERIRDKSGLFFNKYLSN